MHHTTDARTESETTVPERASKRKVGNNLFLCPMPVTIIGTMNGTKPNYISAGWVTRVNTTPPMLGIAISKSRITPSSILDEQAFSVNYPSQDLLIETDYCGLVSATTADKSLLFESFYGELGNVPMIENCPMNAECILVEMIDLPTDYLFIGEIVAAYSSDDYFRNGVPDVRKVNPILLTMPDNSYWTMGEYAGKAWSPAREYKGRA